MKTPVQNIINFLENQGIDFLPFKNELEALKQEEKDYIAKLLINAYNAGYEDMEAFHKNDCNTYTKQIINKL